MILNHLPVLALVVGGALGVFEGVKIFSRKRIFISFAVEDKNIRDLMVGQSCNKKMPFEFADMSVNKPWDSAWKIQCRERILGCHCVIVLVSKNTFKADGVHWEVKCAKEEGLPIKAIYARKDDKGCRLLKELKGLHIYNWSWSNIDKFVDKLNRKEK